MNYNIKIKAEAKSDPKKSKRGIGVPLLFFGSGIALLNLIIEINKQKIVKGVVLKFDRESL